MNEPYKSLELYIAIPVLVKYKIQDFRENPLWEEIKKQAYLTFPEKPYRII
jgi:hypothetical protein